MRKIFTGPNRDREAIYKKVSVWIGSQKGSLKNVKMSESILRSVSPRTLTPKAQGELTVLVTYDKAS